MASEDVLAMITRAVMSGSIDIILRNIGLCHNAGFAHDTLQEKVVMKPSGYPPTLEESGGIRNDNSTASLPNQSLPARDAFIPSASTQNMNTSSDGAIPMAPDTFPSQPVGRRMVAVDLGADLPTEPFCAILDGIAKYSCMTARGVVRLACIYPELMIRPTTPPQRQGPGYLTPAGLIDNPQRFVALTLKALNPAIPPMSVTMLIWEGDGPVADVEVYLGWQMFEKLQARATQPHAGDIRRQMIDFGAINGQNGNARTSGNPSTLLQSDMPLAGSENPTSPATVSYDASYTNTSHLSLPLITVGYGQSLDCSDIGSTQSPMDFLFSEAPCSVTTDSSLNPTLASVDTMAGFVMDLNNDVLADDDWVAELVSCDGGPVYETIDPALLST